jgi:hydroxymethylbilane synthase
VQCRSDDEETLRLLRAIDHLGARLAVAAERAFLSALGGGCSLPAGALALVEGSEITLHGVIGTADGCEILRLSFSGNDPVLLGNKMAQDALERGAQAFLPAGAFSSG